MQAWLRAHLETLPAYTPIEPFEVLSARLGKPIQDIIKLDANENPYGPSEKALQALASLAFPHIYPDPESRALRVALAEFCDVPIDSLMCGSGADELIDMLMRVVLENGETVLNCPPTFGMYPFDALVNGARVIEVARKADFSLDMPALRTAIQRDKPKLVFLATPNNPDGSMLPTPVIEELLSLNTLVVLDEAYIEFCGQGHLGEEASSVKEVARRENLIVLRTFSKWAGLAGLRVGYGVFPAWIMPTLWKAKQPYNVNVAASQAALASLQDEDTLAEVVLRLRNERSHFASDLSQIPFLQPYPSQANFILCKVLPWRGAEINADLLKHHLARHYGILVRYFDKPGLHDHIRISIGKPEQMQVLMDALKEICSAPQNLSRTPQL